MDNSRFKRILDSKKYSYEEIDGNITIMHDDYNRHMDFGSLSTLPKNVKFNNLCGISLCNLKEISDGVEFNNYGQVVLNSVKVIGENVKFNNSGLVDLEVLETLPDDIEFINCGSVFLGALKTLPKDISFKNVEKLDLSSLLEVPEGFEFNNHGRVLLMFVEKLSKNVKFNNNGGVHLNGLKELPKDVEFNNNGMVYFDNLEEIPKGFEFNNSDEIHVGILFNSNVFYQNKKYTMLYVDGYNYLASSTKKIGKYILHRTQRFIGGDLSSKQDIYIAELEYVTAHGHTAREAIEDASYKYRQLNTSKTELVEQIKKKGTINIEEYRLLTGACQYGVNEFLKDNNLEGVKEMKIEEVLKLTKDQYGHDILLELF